MDVAVAGLWHLGTVTAACTASVGHRVVGFDTDATLVANLRQGIVPVSEPGLTDLLRSEGTTQRLHWSCDTADLSQADVLWIAYDTPVDDDDCADVNFVHKQTTALFPHLKPGAVVLVSSQLPVGSVAQLEAIASRWYPERKLTFACSPENLRLGRALERFLNPDRHVIGIRDDHTRQIVTQLFAPITDRLEWMGVESAEMTKHAINSFLALSVTYANELASICERVGADAAEVERGLKTDVRIGPGAYLGAGGPFAGGTLARDVQFMKEHGKRLNVPIKLFAAIQESNNQHKMWSRRRLIDFLTTVQGKTIAVLGLTYKPGTDTLRRSESVQTCQWLLEQGATVRAYDPAVQSIDALPVSMRERFHLCPSVAEALDGAAALIVATAWPEFRDISAQQLRESMRRPLVLDTAGFLRRSLSGISGIEYCQVGRAA